jgi:hypothetical protein
LALAVCALVANSAVSAAPDEIKLSPEDMMEKTLARAAKEKRYVIAYFGRSATPTLKAFREASGKWLARAGHGTKFIIGYAAVSENPSAESDTCFQGLMDKLDPVPKAWATSREAATPCVFLFAPDGKITAFGTGAEWGDDTDANIATFLMKLGITGGAIPIRPELDSSAASTPAPPAPFAAASGKADIGVVVVGVDEATAKRLKLNVGEGVTVVAVAQDGSADKGGLEVDDIILKVNGVNVFEVIEFQKALDSCKPGTPATLEILRNEKPATVKVEVGVKP